MCPGGLRRGDSPLKGARAEPFREGLRRGICRILRKAWGIHPGQAIREGDGQLGLPPPV